MRHILQLNLEKTNTTGNTLNYIRERVTRYCATTAIIRTTPHIVVAANTDNKHKGHCKNSFNINQKSTETIGAQKKEKKGPNLQQVKLPNGKRL